MRLDTAQCSSLSPFRAGGRSYGAGLRIHDGILSSWPDLRLQTLHCLADAVTDFPHLLVALVLLPRPEKAAQPVLPPSCGADYRHLLSQPRRGRRDGEPPEALPRARVASPPSSTLRGSVGPSRRSAVTRLRATDRHRAGRLRSCGRGGQANFRGPRGRDP